MWIRLQYYYWIQNGEDQKYISKNISMDIYEHKMNIEVNLSSEDKKMEDVYELIKEKILNAPERYDRIIKKKNSIISKIGFASGMIPALIICSLLGIIPTIRKIYSDSFVLFPLASIILAYMIGNTFFRGKTETLYSTIVPGKKYAGWDSTNNRRIYEDNIDDYISTSEIIIGKNIDNLSYRKRILDLEERYSKYIPKELIALLVLSIIVIIIGKIL